MGREKVSMGVLARVYRAMSTRTISSGMYSTRVQSHVCTLISVPRFIRIIRVQARAYRARKKEGGREVQVGG